MQLESRWMRGLVICLAVGLFTLGQPVGAAERVFEGRLSSTDLVMPADGSYYKMHEFTAQAGDEITVDMISDDFDAFLFVHSPGGGIYKDDDGGEGTHSRLSATADQTGTWRVFANTLQSGETGAYHIRVQTTDASEFETQTFTGTLGAASAKQPDNDAPFNEHTFDFQSGHDVVFSLTSESFDAMLFAHSPSGQSFSDDDGGEGTNSRLFVSTDQAGTWRIVATSYGADAEGPYTLTVRSRRSDGMR